MFDGSETFALILVVGAALHQLLESSQFGHIHVYACTVIGIALLGWGIGGLLGQFSNVTVAFSFVYILGFAMVPLLRQTKGQPLPE